MYKAVFLDMDGTFLKSDHTVSDANKLAVKTLLAKGIIVVPISARPLHGMLPITNTVFTPEMPVVSLNGSYILHNNEIIYQVAVALPDTLSIHEEIKSYAVTPMYYSQMEWYAEVDNDRIKKEQRITDVAIKIQHFEQIFAEWEAKGIGPNKILIAGDKDLILSVEEKLINRHQGNLNIFKSQPSYLELMNIHASKTRAIQFLIEKYGIKQSEIVAMGDNYNDKGMIAFAAMGVAMGNAPDEIKAVANYVTDTNNNDGVAKAIHHIFGF